MTDRSKLFTRLGKLGDDDRHEVYEYWRQQGAEAMFAVAWDMVIETATIKGQKLNELRFQRSVTTLVRKER